MPDTLGETYTQILTQNKEHRRDAIRILQFLTFSDQPLTVGEMVDAIVVEPGGKIPFDFELRLRIPEEVADICPSLVSIVAKRDKQIVQLAHLSVKEYLTSDGLPAEFRESFGELDALATLTQVCLAYLSHLDNTIPVDEIDIKYPFARYAARKWMEFARVSEERPDVLSAIVKFLCSPQSYRAWRRLFNPEAPWDTEASDPAHAATVALYDASLGGLWRTVMKLLSEGDDVNTEGGIYGSALQAASSRGDVMIAEVLLDGDADVDPPDTGIYGSPLHAGAAGGHAELVNVLIRRGAAIDRQVRGYGSALQAGSAAGHTAVVSTLLHHGAAVNDVGGRYGTALQAACSEGHVKVVEMLLENGADVNSSGKIFHTILQRSASGGRYTPGGSGGDTRRENFGSFRGRAVDSGPLRSTALQAACFRGHKHIVGILLEHGADIYASGGEYGDALQAATSQGHDDIRRLLLEHGSVRGDPDITDHAAFRPQRPERPYRRSSGARMGPDLIPDHPGSLPYPEKPYVSPARGYANSYTRRRARDLDEFPGMVHISCSTPLLNGHLTLLTPCPLHKNLLNSAALTY
jgi:ankyrin repeat protein